jgi:long-subunit fatty acid transport protein
MPKTICFSLALGLALLAAVAAYANQLDEFGFNARSVGLANAYSALTDGPEATYYNPGALIESRDVRALAGYSFSVPALSLNQSGNANGTSPEVKEARTPPPGQWISTGVSGGIFDRVFFGLGMQIPIDGNNRRKIFTPDQPYFLNYDTGIFGMTILPSVAVQLAPNFGLGASARITLDGLGTLNTELSSATGDSHAETMSQSQITGQAAPIFGFYARAFEFLRFALTYKGASYSYFHKTETQQVVPGNPSGYVDVTYAARYNYIPREVTFGVVGEPDEHVLLTAELDWVGWSSYRPPFANVQMNFSRLAAAKIPYTAPTIYEPQNANFKDTIVLRFGVEPRVNKYLVFRVGYAFEPSPAPTQDGTTTIIAPPASDISLGVGANFAGPKGDLVNIDIGITDQIGSSMTIGKNPAKMVDVNPTLNPAYQSLSVQAQYIYSSLTATFHF